MSKNIKKRLFQTGLLIICLIFTAVGFAVLKPAENLVAEATTLTYRTGANGAADTYKASKYYKHVTSIELTGDGVTDTLAVGLSQLGYYEGSKSNPYGGTDPNGTNKTTEYVYNYGDADSSGYRMAWCASFCSWSLYQSRTTNHSTHAQSCRNHIGDSTYIWRECSCYQWADQLKRFGLYSARGTYTPKTGDLIFFKYSSGGTAWTNHIGLVRWCDGATVYTLEGNRGNHVILDSFSLNDSLICGYGRLPYPTNNNALKVDYSGKNKTAGQYITNNATLSVSSVKGGATSFAVGNYEMFNVTGFDGGYAIIEYNGNTGYAQLNSNTIQVTAKAAAQSKNVISVAIDKTAAALTAFSGGTAIPAENGDNPNFRITGLTETPYSYKGLENYGNNKEYLLINGRSLAKWEERAGKPIIDNVWIYSAANGETYLGISLTDNTRLRLKGANGRGEEIETIVIKRGFEIVNVLADSWNDGEILKSGFTLNRVIGHFNDNVLLVANAMGGFDVTVGGGFAANYDGYSVDYPRPQEVEITKSAYVRSGPSTGYAFLGVGYENERFAYLDEIQNEKWLKVEYNGQVGWISNVNAQLVLAQRYVVVIGGADVRSGAGFSYGIIGSGANAETFPFLEELQNGWLKVNFNGQEGWIWSTNAYVSPMAVEITPLNKPWDEEGEYLYEIVELSLYSDYTSTERLAFKFMDDEDAEKAYVDLGYPKDGWANPDDDTAAFLEYIKINGTPIKELFPEAQIRAMSTGDGLALENILLKDGDVVSIDDGARFTHNTTSMAMRYKFNVKYNGEDFVISKGAYLDDVPERTYIIVAVDDYDEGGSETKITFRFMDHTDSRYSNVFFGFNKAGKIDDENATAFLDSIKIAKYDENIDMTTAPGVPVKELFPDAELCATSYRDGLTLKNISLEANDQVIISQDACFIYGDVVAKMAHNFRFTYTGIDDNLFAPWGMPDYNTLSKREYSIVKVVVIENLTNNQEIALRFLNNDDETLSFVNLGYAKFGLLPDDDTNAFLQYIKINGLPVLDVFPNAQIRPMSNGDGLLIENLVSGDGDIIELTDNITLTLDKGATFTHNGVLTTVSISLQFKFEIKFNGDTHDVIRLVSYLPYDDEEPAPETDIPVPAPDDDITPEPDDEEPLPPDDDITPPEGDTPIPQDGENPSPEMPEPEPQKGGLSCSAGVNGNGVAAISFATLLIAAFVTVKLIRKNKDN